MRGQNHDRLLASYLIELDNAFENIESKNVVLTSIYFGGGTPSLALPSSIEAIIKRAKHHVPTTDDFEITLEANPTNMMQSDFLNFKLAGVNRLSLGIQSLNDAQLKFMGRDHTASDALRSIEFASKHFPDRISLDFIWGLPKQTLKEWSEELEMIVTGFPRINHLSLYQLMVERGTVLFDQVSLNHTKVPRDDLLDDMAEATIQIAESNGFKQYETSSFARDGKYSNRSMHNIGYWKGNDYIGLGPGAHGRVSTSGSRLKTIRVHEPERWMTSCELNGTGLAKATLLTNAKFAKELIVFGLRMKEGIDSTSFNQHFPFSDQNPIASFLDRSNLRKYVNGGFLDYSITNGYEILRATDKGYAVIDRILADII